MFGKYSSIGFYRTFGIHQTTYKQMRLRFVLVTRSDFTEQSHGETSMSDLKIDFNTIADDMMTNLRLAGDDSLAFFLAGFGRAG